MKKLGLLAVFAIFVLAACFLADHDAWTPDEPRVVALGQSVAHGSWVAPRLNGEPFLEQPPLHAWSVALAYRAFGETVTVARSVSVVWSLLTLAMTFLLGERLANRRVGALSAILLATSFLFFYAEHRVTADPALAFFVVGSVYASLRGLTAPSRGERFFALLLAYAGASLAYLSKGVVGIGLAGFGFVAVVIALRDAKALLRGQLWLAPLCFLAITTAYHWRLYEECGLQGLKTVVYENTVSRAGTDSQHYQSPAYYLWSFPLHFLPGTFFFLGGIAWFALERRSLDAKGRLAWEVPLVWFALGLLGLSIAKSKREIYVLPLLPGAALVGGLWLERVLERQDGRLLARFVPHVLGVVLVLAGIGLPVGASAILKVGWLVPLAGAAVTVALGVLALALATADQPDRSLAASLAGGLALVVAADLAVVPYVDAQKGLGRPLREAVALVPANKALYIIVPDETMLGSVPFYGGRPVEALPGGEHLFPLDEAKKQLAAHIHGEREVWVLTVEKHEKPITFESVQSLGPEVVKKWPVSREIRLLRFRAR